MREESCVVVLPVCGNSHARVIKIWTRRRIQRKGSPETDQDQYRDDDLCSHFCESQQEQEYITEPDLGQRVFKGEIGLRLSNRPQENSQDDQNEGAPEGMAQHLPKGLSFCFPAGNRERQCSPNQE